VTSAYQYDAAGNRTVEETTSSDGTGTALHVVTTSVYDSHNRVQNVVQDDLISGLRTFDLSYGYDAQGNRTEVVATSGYGTNTTPISTVALPPVVVAAPAAVTLRGGIPVSFAIRASDVFRDPQGSPLAIGVQQLVGGVAQALPTWLTYTMDSTGQLIFSASAGSEASLHQTLTMQLSATDGAGNVVTSNFTVMVVVNSAPRAIAGAPTILLTQPGQPWEAEFDAATYFTDPDVGDTMTLTATVGGGTPSWMTIDPGNPAALRLSGAAPVAGTYTITLRATDAAGAAATQTITLYVATDIAPTVATTIPAQTTNQGQSWLFSIPQGTFADLEGYVLTSSATGMPPGVSFDPASGTFSGTPTASGTFTINVTATDPQGMSVTTPFTLTVANQAPYVNVPLTDQLIPVGVGWTYTIPPGSFMDPNGDPLTYTATLQGGAALPSWISFNAASQKFTGTPPDAEQDTIVVTAADNHGNTVTDQFVMTSGPATPVLQNNLPDLAASFTVPFSYQIPAGTFSDPWNGTLTYTIGNASSLPPEIALSSTGLLTGSLHAVDSGSYNVQIVVSNSYGGSATTTLTIDYTGMPGGNGGGGGRQIQVQQFTLATPQVVTPQVSVLRQQVAWYTYDADNRVSIFDGIRIPKQTVNGVTTPAYIALSPSGGSSYQQFYDAAGHLLDTETYVYDPTTDVDTLAVTQTVLDLRGDVLATYLPQEVTNNHLPATTTTQTFDADGRLLSTFNYFPPGWIYTYPDGEGEPVVVKVGGMLESATTYSYDADGRVLTQTSYQRPYGDSTGQNANGGTSSYPTWILNLSGDQYGNIGVLAMTSQVSYVNAPGQTNLGYDAAGRVKGYTYFNVNDGTSGSTETFLSTYTGYDTWLEATVAGSSTNANDDPTTSTIRYDAAGREVSIDENTPTVNGVTIPDTWRFFTNDGDGQILRRRDGTEPQGGGTFTQPTDTPSLQAATTHMVYANGQEVASMDESGEIDAISHVTAFANSMIGTTQVVVGDNDTLQSLAQRVYGDASLWYVLAAANGLTATATLTSGTTLEAPQVTTNTNDASTFKPYNPSDITGPNAPSLPDIPPPASHSCNGIATIIVALVAVLATVITAGALAPVMASLTTSIGAIGAGMVVGAAVGAVASFSAEAVGSILGVTHFSWKGVAAGAIAGALTGGIAAEAGGSVGTLLNLGEDGAAAAEAVADAGANIVGEKLAGVQTSFSWAGIAASAVGNLVGSAVANNLPPSLNDVFDKAFTTGAVGGMVSEATRSALGVKNPSGYGTVIADAFGDALGSALGEDTGVAVPSSTNQMTAPGGRIYLNSNGQQVFEIDDGLGGVTPVDLPAVTANIVPADSPSTPDDPFSDLYSNISSLLNTISAQAAAQSAQTNANLAAALQQAGNYAQRYFPGLAGLVNGAGTPAVNPNAAAIAEDHAALMRSQGYIPPDPTLPTLAEFEQSQGQAPQTYVPTPAPVPPPAVPPPAEDPGLLAQEASGIENGAEALAGLAYGAGEAAVGIVKGIGQLGIDVGGAFDYEVSGGT
jgi:large repetitive protein